MIHRLYTLIPKRLREKLFPFLSGFYLPVHCYTTHGSDDDERLTGVYLGINKTRARLWARRVLGEDLNERAMGRIWVWRLEKFLSGHLPDCNLTMVETNQLSEKLLSRTKGFKMPIWFQFCVDLDRPWNEIRRSSTKIREQIPRLIRKYNLQLEIDNDRDALENFIDTMHVPYIKGRHKDFAFLTSRQEIINLLKISDLLFIRKDGVRISGVLLEYADHTASLHYLGLKDNNPEYLQAGAIAALYYFAMQRAREKGFKVFNMGGTSPILSDGVANFKLSLKSYVTRISYLDDLFIRLTWRRPTPGLVENLAANPFLFLRRDGGIARLVVVDNSLGVDEQKLDSLLRKTRCGGLATTVFAMSKMDESELQLIRRLIPDSDHCEFVNWQSLFYGM